MIETIPTSIFYLEFKENNENDMAAQVFWAVFYSSRRPSQISPTADFDDAAIPPTIFSMMEIMDNGPTVQCMKWMLIKYFSKGLVILLLAFVLAC